jgi:hypothetical protein
VGRSGGTADSQHNFRQLQGPWLARYAVYRRSTCKTPEQIRRSLQLRAGALQRAPSGRWQGSGKYGFVSTTPIFYGTLDESRVIFHRLCLWKM